MSRQGPMQGGQVELMEALLDGWTIDKVLGSAPRLLVVLDRGDRVFGYQSLWFA